MNVTIDVARLEQALIKELRGRMTAAVLVVESAVVQSISRGQPVKRVGGRLVGLDPSKPGEPPKVVSARLKQSETHDVYVEGKEVVGAVGTNVKYGRSLELGDPTRNLKPRPHLRPGVVNNRRAIIEALTK